MAGEPYSEGEIKMYASVNSMGLTGLNAFPVFVEMDVSRGTPSFDVIGLADVVVKESRERIRAALRAVSCGEGSGKSCSCRYEKNRQCA